jgi:hypothetical protein
MPTCLHAYLERGLASMGGRKRDVHGCLLGAVLGSTAEPVVALTALTLRSHLANREREERQMQRGRETMREKLRERECDMGHKQQQQQTPIVPPSQLP